MKASFILFLGCLAGCAVSTQPVVTPSGNPGYSINCSGGEHSWGSCFQKAGQLCGSNGYDIISQSGEQGTGVVGGSQGIYGAPVNNRILVVECHADES